MRKVGRLAPYLLILLAAVGLLSWARVEQRRSEDAMHESMVFDEPVWSRYLPEIRHEAQRQPTDEAKLASLAELLTRRYREQDAPLRFKVIRTDEGALALRLNAAAALPRWYTARAARLGYEEATRALGREVRVHIYETYIVGSAQLIGVCRARDGVVEVALR
ncbi:MAG: hypothetical protein WHS44_00445 [Fimbriimonadales bacterium]|nr:MAG: hypothetical protein KatS3mg018_0858 [Fimbriimonadales bacterium]